MRVPPTVIPRTEYTNKIAKLIGDRAQATVNNYTNVSFTAKVQGAETIAHSQGNTHPKPLADRTTHLTENNAQSIGILKQLSGTRPNPQLITPSPRFVARRPDLPSMTRYLHSQAGANKPQQPMITQPNGFSLPPSYTQHLLLSAASYSQSQPINISQNSELNVRPNGHLLPSKPPLPPRYDDHIERQKFLKKEAGMAKKSTNLEHVSSSSEPILSHPDTVFQRVHFSSAPNLTSIAATEAQKTIANASLSINLSILVKAKNLSKINGLMLKNNHSDLVNNASKNASVSGDLQGILRKTTTGLQGIVQAAQYGVISSDLGIQAQGILDAKVQEYSFSQWATISSSPNTVSSFLSKQDQKESEIDKAAATITSLVPHLLSLAIDLKSELLTRIQKIKAYNAQKSITADNIIKNRGLTNGEYLNLQAALKQLKQLTDLNISKEMHLDITKILNNEIWPSMTCSKLINLSRKEVNKAIYTKTRQPWYKFNSNPTEDGINISVILNKFEKAADQQLKAAADMITKETSDLLTGYSSFKENLI